MSTIYSVLYVYNTDTDISYIYQGKYITQKRQKIIDDIIYYENVYIRLGPVYSNELQFNLPKHNNPIFTKLKKLNITIPVNNNPFDERMYTDVYYYTGSLWRLGYMFTNPPEIKYSLKTALDISMKEKALIKLIENLHDVIQTNSHYTYAIANITLDNVKITENDSIRFPFLGDCITTDIESISQIHDCHMYHKNYDELTVESHDEFIDECIQHAAKNRLKVYDVIYLLVQIYNYVTNDRAKRIIASIIMTYKENSSSYVDYQSLKVRDPAKYSTYPLSVKVFLFLASRYYDFDNLEDKHV